MWTRGAYHRNEKGKTWTRERGQSLNAARRMVEAGRVFCPPRVQYSPPARKPETDGRRAFSFGRVLDVFGQRAKECSRAAETTRRVFQTRKHETPRVVSVVETHAGGFRYGRNRRRPPRKGTTANLQNANGAPAVPISQKMKSGAKVTRYRQRAKGVSRIVEAFIRSSPKGGAPQTQGEQTAARYGSPRRRRHAPKQKAPPRRVELAKAHPLNGGYLERHALRERILNAPARIVTQFTPYIHPLQGWRSYPFSFPLFLSISSKSGG